jgi:biopolymer transport protein ExbB/TolQ
MARSSSHESQRLGYLATVVMMTLALLFPIGLMVFNPTLMFERGWEQYVGTAIYFWAVLTLGRELVRLWKNERAFAEAPRLLKHVTETLAGRPAPNEAPSESDQISDDDRRVLQVRTKQLASFLEETHSPTVTQLMEVNREASALDQEQMAGRFTLTRYILYLLPVIGFIGTVEGISKALMNISLVLPMVKDLDGFLSNLTSVTLALQIAFDSTLLALFLSAALMLVQTLVFRRSEELLARIDRWVVEQLLPRVGTRDPMASGIEKMLAPHLDKLREDLAGSLAPAAAMLEAQAKMFGERLASPIERFANSVGQLPPAFGQFQQGVDAIGRIGDDIQAMGSAGASLQRGVLSLSRIESALTQSPEADPRLDEIQRGLDRACVAIENLGNSWASAYEKSSRSTQEQLAKTLNSLKDALELINVSMEQGHSLYRSIVKKMFDERSGSGASKAA